MSEKAGHLGKHVVQVTLFDTQYEWLAQRAHDLNSSMAEIVREGIDRAMVANPNTSRKEVDEMVASYLGEGLT